MRAGTVKWFHRGSGYGFIRPNDGKADVFVFYPSIETDGPKVLNSGQDVMFESTENIKGHHATRVIFA